MPTGVTPVLKVLSRYAIALTFFLDTLEHSVFLLVTEEITFIHNNMQFRLYSTQNHYVCPFSFLES